MIKKVLFGAILALACNVGMANADASLFAVNEQEISNEFAQLNELEQYVNANEGVTLSSMDESNPLIANVSSSSNAMGALSAMGEPPLGVPSFFWGLCFSVAGVAIVYFVSDDRDETKKAFIGCAVNGGISLLLWLIPLIFGLSGFLFF